MISADDLRLLSEQSGLALRNIDALEAAAADINEACFETCHPATLKAPRNFAALTTWCATVASSSERLAALILSTTPGDGWAPWDAMELLEPGLPGDGDGDTQPRLMDLLTLAAPDKGQHHMHEQFVSALARVSPGLLAVALVAKRAERHWGKQVARGGKALDRPRRHLMLRLSAIYTQLFGTAPTVSVLHETEGYRAHVVGGRSIDWFSGLFALIEARLPDDAGTESLREIACSARTKSDAVANWITDATRKSTSKRNPRD